MKSTLLVLILFVLVVPAFGNMHKDTYPVPCSDLWPAVKDTLKSSNYGLIASDDTAMTASYTVGYSVRQRTNSVALITQGTLCVMQVNSSYRGLAHDDASDFKARVDQSLAKRKADATPGATSPAQPNASAPNSSTPAAPDSAKGALKVSSNPTGANLTVDGELVGTTPAILKLAPGKHALIVKMSGYKDWSREVTVQSGSDLQLSADLEK